MSGADEFDALIEPYHGALRAIINGDPSAYKAMYSQGEDITLANPFGGVARGRAEVEERLDRAAANFRDGEIVGFETITKSVTSSSRISWRWRSARPRSVAATSSPRLSSASRPSFDRRPAPGRSFIDTRIRQSAPSHQRRCSGGSRRNSRFGRKAALCMESSGFYGCTPKRPGERIGHSETRSAIHSEIRCAPAAPGEEPVWVGFETDLATRTSWRPSPSS